MFGFIDCGQVVFWIDQDWLVFFVVVFDCGFQGVRSGCIVLGVYYGCVGLLNDMVDQWEFFDVIVDDEIDVIGDGYYYWVVSIGLVFGCNDYWLIGWWIVVDFDWNVGYLVQVEMCGVIEIDYVGDQWFVLGQLGQGVVDQGECCCQFLEEGVEN